MQRILKKLPYILCFIVAFVFGMKQLREPDIWWQLLSGRWMLEHGQITHTDVFSYTMAGKPWVNVKWLYEIIIALFEKALGPECVLLLQAGINLLIVYLLFRTLFLFRKYLNTPGTNFFSVAALLLFLCIVEYRMAGRPEMVSHLLCTLYIYLLWRYPDMPWKKILWLIPLQCLWANMHEGYPVGLVIIGTAVAGSLGAYLLKKDKAYLQQTGRIAAVLGGAILIILCNPNTIQLWKQPFEIYRQVWANKYTTELFSFHDIEYWTIEAKAHIILLVSVCLFWMARLYMNRKETDKLPILTPIGITYLLLIPLFGYLSLTANRNIPFAQIILFPSVPYMIEWILSMIKVQKSRFYTPLAKRSFLFSSLLAGGLFLCVITNEFYKFTKSPNRYGIHVSMLHNPTGAAEFIEKNHLVGLPFSDYFVSSYLLWKLYPSFKSYIDLRDLDVFPVSFFNDYFSMYNQPDKFNALDQKYNFNYVVLSTSQLQSLQLKLYWGKNYNLIYEDPVTSVYLKLNDTNKALNNSAYAQKLFNWPAPIEDPTWATLLNKLFNPGLSYTDEDDVNMPIHAAKYYTFVKGYPTGIKMLLPAMPALENNADAYYELGNCYLEYASVVNDPMAKRQKLDSAKNYLEQAKTINPNKEEIYSALSSLSMMTGNYEDAQTYLADFIKLNDHNDYMYFMSGMCARYFWKKSNNDGDRKDMIAAMKRSARINPQNGKAYLYLAEAYLAENDKDEARSYLRKAISSGNSFLTDEQSLLLQLKQQLGIQ